MPAKKIPIEHFGDEKIVGLDSINNLRVQWPNRLPVFLLAFSGLSLRALKLLSAYLGRINSNNPVATNVVFSARDFESACGIAYPDIDALREALLELCVPIDVNDLIKNAPHPLPGSVERNSRRITIIHLFSAAFTAPSTNNPASPYFICLRPSEEAKYLFFNVENYGYYSFLFGELSIISSRQAAILYLFLQQEYNLTKLKPEESNVVKISFAALKSMLLVNSGNRNGAKSSYDVWGAFKQGVLDRAISVLSADPLNYDIQYTTEYEGRKVGGVAFTKFQKKPEKKKKMRKIAEAEDDDLHQYHGKDRDKLIDIINDCTKHKFGYEECADILDLIYRYPYNKCITSDWRYYSPYSNRDIIEICENAFNRYGNIAKDHKEFLDYINQYLKEDQK